LLIALFLSNWGVLKEMESSKAGENFKFNSTVSYRISVKGFLDESWSERFNGMEIYNQTAGEISPMAALVGTLGDQTALIGVLNSLYEMHLPLVSVELLDHICKYQRNNILTTTKGMQK
jgi:hypothetical protein